MFFRTLVVVLSSTTLISIYANLLWVKTNKKLVITGRGLLGLVMIADTIAILTFLSAKTKKMVMFHCVLFSCIWYSVCFSL